MNPMQSRPGCYWISDDPAQIEIGSSTAEPPQSVIAFAPSALSAHAQPQPVLLRSLQFLAAGLFGEGRPCGFDNKIKWECRSHRYGVYLSVEDPRRVRPVILETHGGGTQGVMLSEHVAATWQMLAATLTPEQLWDLCHGIMEYSENIATYTKDSIHKAFAEGRLIKRRRHGNIYVETKPPAAESF